MKPIKVICPICGEEMIPESWGWERSPTLINCVTYSCPCGCKMEYEGEMSCWQKKCKCKLCKNFQEVKDE